MLILTVYKDRLSKVSAVNNRVSGRIFIGKVAQNAVRPNILLELLEEGQDYSHQGPVGLRDAHVRITARGNTDADAALLGEDIIAALASWTGTVFGCRVQLTEHFNSMAGYDDDSEVYSHVSEYTAHYSRTS